MSYFHNTAKTFIESIESGDIFRQLLEKSKIGTESSEYRSWRQSLPEVSNILDRLIQSKKIDDNIYIFIEYNLDFVSLRVDVILLGKDKFGKDNLIVIELKQWSDLEVSELPHHLTYNFLRQESSNNIHPTLQAFEYKNVLKDYILPFNMAVEYTGCSYLHNVTTKKNHEVLTKLELTSNFSFSKYKLEDFENLLISKISDAPDQTIIDALIQKKIRPAKSIIDEMDAFISKNQDMTLIGKQREIYLKVFDAVRKKKNKVFVIVGDPGSGKTVLGVYLLKMLLQQNYDARFLLASKFLNTVLQAQFTNRYPIQHPYVYTNGKTFDNWRPDFKRPIKLIDCFICDEAHRLGVNRTNSGVDTMDENEIIMNYAQVSVFFIDPYQMINGAGTFLNDICSSALKYKFEYEQNELDLQIRSSGSNDYIDWVTKVFNKPISHVKKYTDHQKFFIEVCDTPFEMEKKLQKHIDNNETAKILAGFTWDWSNPKTDGSLVKDIKIDIDGIGIWEKAWNRKPAEDIDKKNKRKPSSEHEYYQWYRNKTLDEVGCIYSSQGVEFDYIGVILGPDIKKTFAEKSLNTNATVDDRTLLGTVSGHNKDKRKPNIMNIYRTLMTRAKKGVYIYAVDPEVRDYFKLII